MKRPKSKATITVKELADGRIDVVMSFVPPVKKTEAAHPAARFAIDMFEKTKRDWKGRVFEEEDR